MKACSTNPPAVRTTCPYCGVGCGVLARPDGHGGATIEGDGEHPANFGRLCSKGSALGETFGLAHRLLHPMMRSAGGFEPLSWPAALAAVAHGFARILARDGPDAVAFYLSGQLLTEDYYVANKLMKGFIGSANVDTNSRLCMASTVAGQRRAFGADTVPGTYADLDAADLVVLVGSNAAWCHPILFQRLVANKRERGAKLVVVDPRRTATAEEADLFLPLAPGTDAALFCGLLVHLADNGALDRNYVAAHTTGFPAALERARAIAPDVAATAATTGLRAEDVAAFFALFRATERVVTSFSQGVNQSAQGTDKVNAIINCHLATGRIGRPGMGPFSLTGQPNAMGGREVGGLSNQVAAHMGFTPEDVDRVRRFWRAPRIAEREGLMAVEIFEAVERGDVKALWVMGTNPAVSLPDADRLRRAFAKLELFVVSENVASNDTLRAGAHILLPAAAWGEKSGTVTNSERRISRQRAFLPLPDEARPDWWMLCEVARRMGFADGFGFRSAADIFREHAALSGFENDDGRRDFNIGALAALSDEDYDRLDPVLWPLAEKPQAAETRFFASGGFFTADRRARFIAVAPPGLRSETDAAFPFRLNTGRVRDQWHTMTRTGASPRLGQHLPEPFVEVHPQDAAAAGLRDGGFARVSTRTGACLLKVAVTQGQRRGSLFVPIHWSDETATVARVGALVEPHVDPVSGQPEAKGTPAAIVSVALPFRGFVLARAMPRLPGGTWWSRVATRGGVGVLFASANAPFAWRDHVQASLPRGAELAEYLDAPRGVYRAAAFSEGRLESCFFVGPEAAAPQWDAVRALFEADTLGESERRVLLSGRAAGGAAASGPVVCACFGVALGTIEDALRSGDAKSVADLSLALKAGTNCGSCLPELKKIVAGEREPAPA